MNYFLMWVIDGYNLQAPPGLLSSQPTKAAQSPQHEASHELHQDQLVLGGTHKACSSGM
jgi:hypothetical protein